MATWVQDAMERLKQERAKTANREKEMERIKAVNRREQAKYDTMINALEQILEGVK